MTKVHNWDHLKTAEMTFSNSLYINKTLKKFQGIQEGIIAEGAKCKTDTEVQV